ncbi:uncharacterized protein [Montipora capricornis]|uniref:uncharacterized protein n=1 Tax=Montipora capricornis TaxID=246305 RepID=UPI0035F1623B
MAQTNHTALECVYYLYVLSLYKVGLTLIMNGQPGPNGLSLEEVEALMVSNDDEALVESLRLAEEKDMDIDDEHEVMLATSPFENALSMVVTPPTPATDMEQQGQGFDISFIPFRHRTSQRYGITRDTFRLRWTSPNELHDALEPEEFARQLLNALFEGVQRHIQQFDPNGFLQVYMASNRLQHNYTSHRVRVRDWLASSAPGEGLLTHLQNVLNSNQNFEPDDTFVFDVTQIRDPRGGGRRKLGSTFYANLLKKKKSVIVIKNDDVLCCARALVTAKARHEQDQSVDALRKYQALRDGRPIQEHCARELHKAARVPIGTCGLGEIQLFEIVLAPCQLVVVSADHGNSIIYKGPPHDKQLILLLKGNHYDVITSLEGYFARKYFCLECEKGFDHDDYRHHQCPGSKCYACHQTTCEAFKLYRGRSAETPCDSCGRQFFGQDCYLKHCTFNDKGEVAQPSKRDSVCQTHRKCSECGRTLMGSKDIREHQCGRQPCPSCERVVNLWQHKCYIQPVCQKNKRKRRHPTHGAAAGLCTLQANAQPLNDEDDPLPPLPASFVFFDIEARQDEGHHVANLLCAETSLNDQQHTFAGESCVRDFLVWLFRMVELDLEDENRPWIAVAHNFQGYDGYMILEELYNQNTAPKQISNGAKILSISLPNTRIKFIDSLNFFLNAIVGVP